MIDWIEIAAESEALAIRPLHEIKHDGAMPRRGHIGQFVEMLGSALGGGIGKFGDAGPAREMHVLHLDIGHGQTAAAKQQVDA